MKPEIIIKNWLMSWFKPEVVTAYNTQDRVRPPLTNLNFGSFMSQFKDETGEQEFTDDEKGTLEQVILNPLKFASGYPSNAKEAIQVGAIYFIGAGWQQTTSWPGANFWHGRAATQIAMTGLGVGNDFNMAEPSLLQQLITSLLIAGHGYFTSQHMENPMISETLYSVDETNSYGKGFAIRTTTISYEYERHGIITQWDNK